MKKTTLIAILCCIVPIAILVALFLSRGNQSRSSQPSQTGQTKTVTETADATIGKAFPAFSVVDIDGQSISNDTLKGKPTIIWFTATFCTPCQIGAKKVAQLQKELGDNKLNVLVVFVDPKESESDLRNWRSQFANPDWKLAFNNGLAEKIGIRYLDSKYLLGNDGVIKDFNTSIADDQYLSLIRSAVNASK